MLKNGLYPLYDWPTIEDCIHYTPSGGPAPLLRNIRAKPTGEFREPRKGEWFLSGAIVEAYRTRHDLSTKYHIARLVRVITETKVSVIEADIP